MWYPALSQILPQWSQTAVWCPSLVTNPTQWTQTACGALALSQTYPMVSEPTQWSQTALYCIAGSSQKWVVLKAYPIPKWRGGTIEIH